MKNILIAEDDKNFGIILQNECRTKNIPLPVRDVVKAVLSFISKSYDFILMDIGMPRLNGIDALRIIKRIKPLRSPSYTPEKRKPRRHAQEVLQLDFEHRRSGR